MKGLHLLLFSLLTLSAFSQRDAAEDQRKKVLLNNKIKFVESYQFNFDGGKQLPDSSKYSTTRYNEKGNMEGMLIFPGEISFVYFYDSLGRASEMVQSNGKGTGLFKYKYSYAKHNDLLVTENIYSPLEKTYSQIRYKYNFRKRLKKAIHDFGTEKYITIYKYDGTDHHKSREIFLNRRRAFRMDTDYMYDEKGNCIQTITSDKKRKTSKKVFYTYNVAGLLTSELREDEKGVPVLMYRYYYTSY
jgi:hypothetical protein